MPLSSRERKAALETDRLRTAMQVIETFDSMAARRENLEMQRGQMEAQALMDKQRLEASKAEVEVAKARLTADANEARDTGELFKLASSVDPDEEGAFAKIGALSGQFKHASPQAQRAAELALTRAAATDAELKELSGKYGIDPSTLFDEVDRGDGTKVRKLNRVKMAQTRAAADADFTSFRESLKSYDDIDRYDTLVQSGKVSYRQARQMLEGHAKIQWTLDKAAELGMDGGLIKKYRDAASRTISAQNTAAMVDPTSGDPLNTSTKAFLYQDDAVAPEIRAEFNKELNRLYSFSAQQDQVVTGSNDALKQVSTLLDTVKAMQDGEQKDALLSRLTEMQTSLIGASVGASSAAKGDEAALKDAAGAQQKGLGPDATAFTDQLKTGTQLPGAALGDALRKEAEKYKKPTDGASDDALKNSGI